LKSPFTVFLACSAGAVIVLDAICAVMALTSDCAALMAILLWTLAAALYAGLVLLPALVRFFFVAPLGPRALRLVLAAAVATAIPAAEFSLHKYPHQGHCIA